MDKLDEEVNSLIGQGVKVEREHSQTYLWLVSSFNKGSIPPAQAFFEHIAMDHLKENPDYYKTLKEVNL